MHRLTVISLLAVLFAGCIINPAAWAAYSVQSIGIAPGYDGSWGADINEYGEVICASISVTDNTGVFTWSLNDGFTDLSGHGIQASSGISNQGQTVGMHKDETTGYYTPFIRNADGTTTDLPLPTGASDAWPVIIDGTGRVVADVNYRNAEGIITETRTTIISRDGSTTFVEYPNGYTQIKTISNNGTIVTDSYMWTESEGLHTLPWLTSNTTVRAVNDLGWIVGISDGHVLRWDSTGNMSDLGMGQAFGINNLGQIVGAIDNHAVIWNTNNSVTELPNLDGYLTSSAYAINNMGQVVGEGTTANGQRISLFWQPVPEPSSIVALLCGMAGLTGYSIRRRVK